LAQQTTAWAIPFCKLVIKIEVTSMSSKIRSNRNFIGAAQCKDASNHLPHGLFLLGDCAEFSFVLLQLDG
jgi:hypothetical protein